MAERSTVRLDGREVPYVIVRSPRARLVRLRIGPEPAVTIVLPNRHPLGRVEDVLAPHRRWIFKHLDRLEAIGVSTIPRRLRTGDRLPFLGVDRTLDIRPDDQAGIVLTGDCIRVSGVDAGAVSRVLVGWCREQARAYLAARAVELSCKMHVTYARITIRDQRTRWGSCSSRGTLSFNWRLILAPPEVCDYLVIHELAHLAVPNHSAAFWELVERHCADRKVHERWLRENTERLAGYLRYP